VSELQVRGVSVDFGGGPVLDSVDLTVAAGEVVALLGPSGSGKSTLLRVIAGIQPPASGRITIDGHDVTNEPTHRRRVGLVFQDNQLFPHRDVLANVEFGLKMGRVSRSDRSGKARGWLERVGLTGFDHREVTGLSGGEATRVALARTLVAEPRIVLLDEPLTGLDRELHDRLAGELSRILRDSGSTALLVTHDHDEAEQIADRVVRLDELSSG
jgi:thiamine transport system ATP-binding protein